MMFELFSEVQRNAARKPNRSRSEAGMMSQLGCWVAAMTGMPQARPSDTRPRSSDANSSCCGLVPSTVENIASSSMIVTITESRSVRLTLRRSLARSHW
jgi:hypothetical protein